MSIFEWTKWITILAYLSIALELIAFHVPSVASTVNIWNPDKVLLASYSDRFRVLFELPKLKKIIVFILPLLLVYLTFFFPLFYFLWQPEHLYLLFQPTEMSYLIGILFILLGRWITFSSVLTIRKENKQAGDSFKLHTGSLFSRTRNPGLVGMYVLFVGLWCCIPSPIFLVGILAYIGHMHFKVLMEENFLTNKYGQAYKAYFTHTKRYLV